VVGVLLNYFISPQGSPLLLFGGVFLVVLAIIVDALAYRRRETLRKNPSARGIQISLACGVLMGVFIPWWLRRLPETTRSVPIPWRSLCAGHGVVCGAVNYFLMRRPLTGGPPVSMADYWKGRSAFHWWGILGGMIWCTGAVLNFVASHAQVIGPAVSYAIGQGATMVSAIWGVFIWKEFATAPPSARKLIPLMFIFFSWVGRGRDGSSISEVTVLRTPLSAGPAMAKARTGVGNPYGEADRGCGKHQS